MGKSRSWKKVWTKGFIGVIGRFWLIRRISKKSILMKKSYTWRMGKSV